MEKTQRSFSIILALGLLAGCSGGNRLIPTSTTGSLPGAEADRAVEHTRVSITMTIPHRRRGERAIMHPGTISGETLSVGITVNRGALQKFNVTPTSPGCTSGTSGTTCTLHASAPIGSDTFAVSTYSAIDCGGAVLDRGTITAAIARGKANAPHITLGPVVSTNADSGPGSLRDAVANANPGDTIMFVIPASSTITFASPITISKNEKISGPGFTANGSSYSGLTLNGNGATQLFIIPAASVVTLSGLVLENGTANVAHSPGGVVSNKGALDLDADALVGSTSNVQSALRRSVRPHCASTSNEGGAVYNAGALAVEATTFDSNTVKSTFESGGCGYGLGGAIYNDASGSMAIADSAFKNNGAYEGGAVFNSSTGGVSFNNDSFTGNTGCNTAALGCAVSCQSSTSCSSFARGNGGAIYDSSGPGITVSGGTFSDNVVGGNVATSGGSGGALYLNTGHPSVKNATFTSNQAGGGTTVCSVGTGGAIYAAVALELDGDTFTSNTASGDYGAQGGAVVDNSAAITGSNDTFTSNTAQGFGGSACAPIAAAGGGAIFTQYSISLTGTNNFSKNQALGSSDAYGGALFAGQTTTIAGATFDQNSVVTSGLNATNATAEGGAITANSALTLTNDTITNNTATLNGSSQNQVRGGAVFSESGIGMSGNTVSGNSAIEGSSSAGNAFGGAVYAAGLFTSSHDAFSTNTATGVTEAYGGAVYGNGQVDISGASESFDHNKVTHASTGDGGALYIGGSGGGISIATFTNNTATDGLSTGNGGAIFDAGGTTFGNLTVTNNSALSSGGGVYSGANDVMDLSTISSNTVTGAAGADGGGGVFDDGAMVLTNSTISGNQVTITGTGSTAGGGGIYDSNGLTLENSTVSGNIVTGGASNVGTGGGGIMAFDNAKIVNSTIDSNLTSGDGGGIESTYGTVTLTNATLLSNYAANSGGNVEIYYCCTGSLAGAVTFANDAIGGGTAFGGSGADVDANGSGALVDNGYNIVQTAATGAGGSFTGVSAGDSIGSNPGLAALASNGGPTQTNADSTSSAGYEWISFQGTGVTSQCGNVVGSEEAVDQRGYSRGAFGLCDAGAYEYNGTAPAIRVRLTPKRTIGHHLQHPPRRHSTPLTKR